MDVGIGAGSSHDAADERAVPAGGIDDTGAVVVRLVLVVVLADRHGIAPAGVHAHVTDQAVVLGGGAGCAVGAEPGVEYDHDRRLALLIAIEDAQRLGERCVRGGRHREAGDGGRIAHDDRISNHDGVADHDRVADHDGVAHHDRVAGDQRIAHVHRRRAAGQALDVA